MLTYNFEWEKEGKTGSFKVTGYTDDECVNTGHAEVEKFGGEVVDYYQTSPSTKQWVKKLMNG